MLEAGLSMKMIAGYTGHDPSSVYYGVRRLKEDMGNQRVVVEMVQAVELGLNANE